MIREGSANGPGQLAPIQALRGIAALSVVVGHCLLLAWHVDLQWRTIAPMRPFNIGGGVDLFFVISGFIMVHAARGLYGRAGRRALFAARRIARLVPLHWVVTAASFAFFLWKRPHTDAVLAALSFVFVPYSPDGMLDHVVPIAEPAWTLSFEMLFYALFGLCLAGSARATVLRTGALLIGLVAVGFVLPATPPAWLFTWTRPLLLEFVAGMAIGLVFAGGWRLPARLTWPLLLGGLTLLYWPVTEGSHWQGWERVALALPAASAIVAAAALGQWQVRENGVLVRLGDASYSLYLWHLLLLIVLRRAWWHMPEGYGWAFALTGLAVSLAAGMASWRWLEMPMLQWARNRIARCFETNRNARQQDLSPS